MGTQGTLLLTRQDIAALLPFPEYVKVVETAFRLHANGKSLKSELIHVSAGDGEFHIKAGGLELDHLFFAVKVNGGFFNNRERFKMDNIQGSVLLCDGENGYPLAIMDSGQITVNRTGAAAAVAAKYLARSESTTATICGCGTQGRIQMIAMKSVLPIRRFWVFDISQPKARAFAKEMEPILEVEVSSTDNLEEATRNSHVIVTCTPSRQPFLKADYVSRGTFVAAMGADSPDKQELDPDLLRWHKVVVDLLEQCATVGELHHAILKGMNEKEVYADLGAVVSGIVPGRTSQEEIIIFDSTGTALQDVAAAAAVYQQALRRGLGQWVNFFK